jgi:hypothetical protein
MNGWHETCNDEPGPDVVCGHLGMIASPPAAADPPDACGDCLREGSTWVELRRCLVGGQAWGWCYADELALSPDT